MVNLHFFYIPNAYIQIQNIQQQETRKTLVKNCFIRRNKMFSEATGYDYDYYHSHSKGQCFSLFNDLFGVNLTNSNIHKNKGEFYSFDWCIT